MRLLFVTSRYGTVVGGAETAVRGLVENCCGDGWEPEVATTCARNHYTWENELPTGTFELNGVRVRRFRVSCPPRPSPARLAPETYLGGISRLARSVWSRDLHRFLAEEGESFDLILLAPYLHGVTFWGAHVHPDRSALIPCLHDEAEAHLAPMRDLLERVRGCLFNSHAEARLASRLAHVRRARVVGLGLDLSEPVPESEAEAFRAEFGIEGDYVIYFGRLEEGKRVDVLVDYVERYNRAGRNLTLVLAGEGTYRPPGSPAIRLVGFLSERQKRAATRGALALCTASVLESFSLVVLEAWRERTPVLASQFSEVIADHLRASGGGLSFRTYAGFALGVERLRDPAAREAAGASGRAYVEERYTWGAVRGRFREAVEDIVG